MRVFKGKKFHKYCKNNKITDKTLMQSLNEIEDGLIDCDYGGGLIKKRIAKQGQGKSGGYRSILAFKTGDKAFYMFGFEKSDKGNLSPDEVKIYKQLSKAFLNLGHAELDGMIKHKDLYEVECDES